MAEGDVRATTIENLGLNPNWRDSMPAPESEEAQTLTAEPEPQPEPEPVEEPSEPSPEPVAADTPAEEETPPEPSVEAPKAQPEHQAVPLSVFKSVRDDLRETRAELARLREQQAAPPVKEDPAPDPEADPDAYEKWERRQEKARIDRLEQELQQTKQGTAQQRERAQLQQQYQRAYHAAVVQNPEVESAYNFYLTKIQERLLAKGVPEDRLADAIVDNDLGEAFLASRRGRDMVQHMMGLAYADGWRPESAKPSAPSGEPEPQKNGAAEKLEKAAKGKEVAGRTPSGGAQTDKPLTIADVLAKTEHNPKEFAKHWRKFRETRGNSVA